MSATTLAAKLKLKPGQKVAVINPPEGYLQTLAPVAGAAGFSNNLDDQFDWVQVFVRNKDELGRWTPLILKALKAESLLWLTFPKGSSKIQTDLTRDLGWECLRGADLKWINLVSVDETWSAFSLRPYRPGEARQSFR